LRLGIVIGAIPAIVDRRSQLAGFIVEAEFSDFAGLPPAYATGSVSRAGARTR